MIPKSVIETTIDILEGGLDAINEILQSNRKQDVQTIKVYSMIKTFEPQVAVYELLIAEYRKYLEENYGGVE